MIVRLLKPWKSRRVGTILSECPDGVANLLLKRGVAEELKPEPKPEAPKERKRLRVAN